MAVLKCGLNLQTLVAKALDHLDPGLLVFNPRLLVGVQFLGPEKHYYSHFPTEEFLNSSVTQFPTLLYPVGGFNA